MILPDAAFLHRLADLANTETMPRYRTAFAVDTKPKAGYTFDPVTEAGRDAEAAIRAEIDARFPDHAILGEDACAGCSILVRWVDDYNTERPHSLLGYATPAAFTAKLAKQRTELTPPVASPALLRDNNGRSLVTAG